MHDADTNPTGMLQRITDGLKIANLPAPRCSLETVGTSPAVTIYIVPGDDEEGMLEDLCMRSVEGKPETRCVDDFMGCLEGLGDDYTPPRNRAKSRVQAFLATCEKYKAHSGEAADAGEWPWESPAFDGIKRFLNMVTAPRDSA